MMIFGLIYLGVGIAFSFLDPRIRALQIKAWSLTATGWERFVKPFGGMAASLIMAVVWPVCLYQSVREVIKERKIKKTAELYGLMFGGGVEFKGGDGLTRENAVILEGANNISGVGGEHHWLRKNYPGCRLIGQTMFKNGDQSYDQMEIETKSGDRMTIYFNITNFLGAY